MNGVAVIGISHYKLVIHLNFRVTYSYNYYKKHSYMYSAVQLQANYNGTANIQDFTALYTRLAVLLCTEAYHDVVKVSVLMRCLNKLSCRPFSMVLLCAGIMYGSLN